MMGEQLLQYEAGLPSREDIATAPASAREFTNKGLLRRYREVYGALVAKAVFYNVIWAWDHLPGTEGGPSQIRMRCGGAGLRGWG